MSNDRNAPCPCGSGLKYKHCCLSNQETPPSKWKRNLIGAVVVAAAIALLVWAQYSPDPKPGDGAGDGASTGANWENGVPPPYYHDTANNRHWDPNHGHWHDGPPPSQTGLPQRSGTRPVPLDPTTPEAATPAPWHYDAANNRHWNPDHGHWHDGPPPGGVAAP